MKHTALIRTPGAPDLFGMWHWPTVDARDAVVVIAYPLGHEYTHGYRTYRELGDRLAARGLPTLRFDYRGTGNSADGDGTLDTWGEDLARACRYAGEATGGRRTFVIGIRVGGLLAIRNTADTHVARLALWNPVLNGRRYVRELKAIAASGASTDETTGTDLEVAGFAFGPLLIENLAGVTLEAPPGAMCLTPGSGFDGWNDMIAEPQFAQLPDAALAKTVEWALEDTMPAPLPAPTSCGELHAGALREAAACEQGVFGVLTRSSGNGTPVLLLNSGSVHHVGPHRLYVELARGLARAGHSCLRIDFRGLGESEGSDPTLDNHPYPATSHEDARRAIARLGDGPVTVAGICSGAYAAFRATLENDLPIREAILLNPLTFQWREGMSLETSASSQLKEIARYRQNLRTRRSWRKLLSGQVKITHAGMVGARQVRAVAEGAVARWRGSDVARDLHSLVMRPDAPRLQLWVSPGEPGVTLLHAEAGREADRAIAAGRLAVRRLAAGDHTFSRRTARRSVIEALIQHLDTDAQAA